MNTAPGCYRAPRRAHESLSVHGVETTLRTQGHPAGGTAMNTPQLSAGKAVKPHDPNAQVVDLYKHMLYKHILF